MLFSCPVLSSHSCFRFLSVYTLSPQTLVTTNLETKGLCPVLNNNWICLMLVVLHICIAVMEGITDMPLEGIRILRTYLVFTCMSCENYLRRPRSLLFSPCDVFRALINFLVCWLSTGFWASFCFRLNQNRSASCSTSDGARQHCGIVSFGSQ